MIEDKMSLTKRRVELVESLAGLLPPEERARIQGELSIVNVKIKILNTTEAAQLNAAAKRRKIAGLVEAQANAARARGKIDGGALPEDAAPSQTEVIDGWIDAVLLRHDVDFVREEGELKFGTHPALDPVKLVQTIAMLANGIYAAARGEELPDLPPSAPKASKTPSLTTKSKKR